MSLYITIAINDIKLEKYYAHCLIIDKDNIGVYEIGKYGQDGKPMKPVRHITHSRDLGASQLAWRTIKEVMDGSS